MKIFLDTADVVTIQKWARAGIIDGVTTNPTHLNKAGGDPLYTIREICSCLPQGCISVEVTEPEPDAIFIQAKAIAKISDNIAVKIPCYVPYYPVIKKLVYEGISINITLVFTLAQGLAMSKLGADYISPFVGRLDDANISGIKLVEALVSMKHAYGYDTQILAASIRSHDHLQGVIAAGADVATVPATVLEDSLSHELTDKGMKMFLDDWKKLGIAKFP
jgi:transaldolase